MQVPMIRNQESRDQFNKTSTSVFTSVAVILESENNGYNPGQNVWDTLSFTHIRAFSINPPPPLNSVGCYRPKTFEKYFKVYV